MTVFKALGSAPSSQYPHAARWYSHIESYASEHSSLPGDSSKSADDLVPKAASTSAPAAAPKAAAEEDDDDVDLFGSDDEEEDAEAERIKQERLKAYAEKKAGKVKPAAKVSGPVIFQLCSESLTWMHAFKVRRHLRGQALG